MLMPCGSPRVFFFFVQSSRLRVFVVAFISSLLSHEFQIPNAKFVIADSKRHRRQGLVPHDRNGAAGIGHVEELPRELCNIPAPSINIRPCPANPTTSRWDRRWRRPPRSRGKDRSRRRRAASPLVPLSPDATASSRCSAVLFEIF